jgi:Uma2 family endonuclease
MSGRDEVMRTSPGVKLTYDDFLLFPDDGNEVDEYWVIDPDAETITVYRRDGENDQRIFELAAAHADTLTTPLLPGLITPLARIFKD